MSRTMSAGLASRWTGRALVLAILKADLVTELDRAVAYQQQVVGVVENWWSKYREMWDIEERWDASKGQLGAVLKELGYVG